MVTLAPCGHQGRGVRPRRQHALRRDGYGASPHPSALSANLLCPWPNGKRDQRPQAVPEIGSHVLSPLRGQSDALILAFGSLYAAGYPTPRGVKDDLVGLRHDSNAPVTLTQA